MVEASYASSMIENFKISLLKANALVVFSHDPSKNLSENTQIFLAAESPKLKTG